MILSAPACFPLALTFQAASASFPSRLSWLFSGFALMSAPPSCTGPKIRLEAIVFKPVESRCSLSPLPPTPASRVSK